MDLSALVNAPALVKVAAFFFVWGMLWLPVATASAIALNWHPPQPLDEKQKLILLASLYLIVPFVIWGISKAEGVALSNYGIWTIELWVSGGIGFSLAIMSLILLLSLEKRWGWLELQLNTNPDQTLVSALLLLLALLLLALWIGGTEEFVFRGFLYTQLQQDYSRLSAAAIASLIFAITHLIWQVRQTLPQLPGLWLMGMVLTLACLGDRGNLGLAIGLHAGWIWGFTSLNSVGRLSYSDQVPKWITGIADQPLAGVVGIVMLLGVAGVLALNLLHPLK